MPGELQRRPPTRAALTRAIAVNAATKPVNVAVPAAVAIVAALAGIGWLWPVAVVVYVALVAATFFDADEAEAVGKRRRVREEQRVRSVAPLGLAPPIAQRLKQALAEEQRIRETIEGAEVDLDEVNTEVDGLVANLEKSARRAQLVYSYLTQQDPKALEARARELTRSQDPDSQRAAAAVRDQMKLAKDLEATLERFYAQMDHAVVSLQTIRGELVRMSVAGEAEQQADTVERVRNLREEVGAMADGMSEAYARADSA
jgi:seryl-tRNA synthetase